MKRWRRTSMEGSSQNEQESRHVRSPAAFLRNVTVNPSFFPRLPETNPRTRFTLSFPRGVVLHIKPSFTFQEVARYRERDGCCPGEDPDG